MPFDPSAQNQKIIDGVVILSEFDADVLGNPPADKTFLYAEDNGLGSTVLKTKDSSGTEKTILTEGAGPLALGSISGAVTLNRNSGQYQNATATANVTINVSGGTDWSALDFWLIASGVSRTLDLNTGIQKPSDSAISFPVTITGGQGCRVKFEKHGSTFMLVSLVKSYTL
jgi:hypothetical protein